MRTEQKQEWGMSSGTQSTVLGPQSLRRNGGVIMKGYFRRTLTVASVAVALVSMTTTPVAAQFNSGSTGADGAFNPSCAPTPCTVTVALPASGIFNFTTVNVPAGVTVMFSHNPANTPVTILASGDVTIAGTIDVSGQDGFQSAPGRGGPGGFDGGPGRTPTGSQGGTSGLGPGGGSGAIPNGASFGTRLGGPPTYGLPTLLPLIGGSGGGGSPILPGGGAGAGGGGGGGGAILIASSGNIAVTGTVRSNGGNTSTIGGGGSGACGSGGAIRLIANQIAGNGTIQAKGRDNVFLACAGLTGSGSGEGRIRFEASNLAFNLTGTISPAATFGLPGPVFTPADFPAVKITSVGGAATPLPPQGTFVEPPDITLSPVAPNPVTINLQANNVPVGTLIAVSVKTEGAGAPVTVNSTPLVGTLANSTATASVTLPNATSVISATATFVTP